MPETNLRICIPIDVRPEGGMYTFIGNFLAWLETTGHEFTQDITGDYDVLFVNSWVVAPEIVRRVKRERLTVRVVHRVDGAALDYGSNPASDRLQARVNLFADITIFQSNYSRFSAREKFRVIAQDGPIIYNPVDTALFTPEGPRIDVPADRPRAACAAWSVNRRKGTWRIDELAAQHPDITFVLCGRFDAVSSRPNVLRLGHISRADMSHALRSCDVFLNLSENDPCPNVVLEALASGLPVLYRDSGGVPELVGDCGAPIEVETFRAALDRVLADQEALASKARQRAVRHFAPDEIFPRYWDAMASAVRRPLPTRTTTLRLAAAGYPVLPAMRTPRELAARFVRAAPLVLRHGREHDGLQRVGWVTYDSFPRRKRRLEDLDTFTGMRAGNVARWMNAHESNFWNEIYDPDRRYDVVIFQKMMDKGCQAEAEKVRAYGGRMVFDANVNYYHIWGDYFIPSTRPTSEQQDDARRMTQLADWVVADSSYLEGVIRPLNPNVTWIPDNVDTSVYRGLRQHRVGPLRLVWSGIGRKAGHLLDIRDVLAELADAELTLVVDDPPECLPALQAAIPCRLVSFSHRRYARTLLQSDVVISPKRLTNGYEMAHTEYKITLGMAVGLPAIASPQQSYVEAISHRGGGVIASTLDEWRAALEQLRSATVRAELGQRARQTVDERYATPVVAAQYHALLALVSSNAGRPTSATGPTSPNSPIDSAATR